MFACTRQSLLGTRVVVGAARGISREVHAASRGSLKILVVDRYQKKSRDEFQKLGLPLAGELYSGMLRSAAPAGVDMNFDILQVIDVCRK